MNDPESLWITPYASIRIIRLSEVVTSAELFLWPAGSTSISARGADRHEALQRLEKQMRGLADAVSGTFTHEAYSDDNRYHDIDLVSRISTGKMASEGYRRERRARAWRIVGLVLFGALVIGSAFALTTADARLPATVDAPPGPVCPFGNATQRSCF